MPHLILIHGNIYTQDPACLRAEAVAIDGDRILAVGNVDEIKPLARRGTEIVDLGGRPVLPGMTDSHVHFLTWAMMRQGLCLSEAASMKEVLGQVARRVHTIPPGRWITGWGLDESRWPETRLPARSDLDGVAPAHPVLLRRKDGHLAVVNTCALKIAQVNENTPNPEGGVIDRDGSGRPSGILKEHATDLVEHFISGPTEEEALEAKRQGISVMHSLGVTGVHDMRMWGGTDGQLSFRAWEGLRQEGRLNLRCCMALPGELLEQAITLGLRTGFGDKSLRIGNLKFFVDGSMGSKTAWMLEPYLHGGVGLSVASLDILSKNIARANDAGLAVNIHAIGDRANREISKILEHLENRPVETMSSRAKRPMAANRIEHLQIIEPEDLARFARLNIIASVQPLHVTDEIAIHEASIGVRCRRAYPFRDMMDSGINVIFGSDCPVSDPNPFWGIHAAVTRRRRDGSPEKGWYPEQRVTVSEAVRAYTMGPALASGRGSESGSITPGKLADLIVLDRDIYRTDPMEIHKTRVDLTLFDGRIVFQRKESCH
jgi:predicted amidohydrolase YtcJ